MKGDYAVCSVTNYCPASAHNNYYNDESLTAACNCRPVCHDTIYDYTISQSFFSDNYMRSIGANKSHYMSNIAIVYIYPNDLLYTSLTMTPSYTFLAMLCDVGGTLGLLLGATLLTVYQMAEFFVILVADLVAMFVRRKMKSKRAVGNMAWRDIP